ncbi:MAG: discoidin domain-containing protein [Porphyromonadaceae bacterium]|nr:discoidin domain-containing protein [Porphyromonadaceae bacterium]
MRLGKIAPVLMAACSFGLSALAQQPFGGCWHPDGIKNWSIDKYPEAKFNRSTIPLQKRFNDDGIKANTDQKYQGQVAACLTMNPNCSTTPAQGANNFIGYNPNHWQYMDVVVWWGGSAGEGIITAPSAPAIDIAHLHGVRILGTLFFPELAHGGNTKEADKMFTMENGTYPYAIKLYEIARDLGFDGWLLNDEGSSRHITDQQWEGFMKAFLDKAKSEGKDMELQYYDAYTNIGSTLKKWLKFDGNPGVSYFVNYGGDWRASQNKAGLVRDLGADKYFQKVYYGINNAASGLYGGASIFNNLFPAKQADHVGSIQLFNPEEHIWKKKVEHLLGTPQASGPQAYAAMSEVFKNAGRFWVNTSFDPTKTRPNGGYSWPGMSAGIQERSAITSLPFVTSFGTGLGKYRFVQGEKRGTGDWYHVGMQDVLPTWRWWVEAKNGGVKSNIHLDFNWDDAYNSGSSLVVSGPIRAKAEYLVHLYKTKINLKGNEIVELVYKGDTDKIFELVVSTDINGKETQAIEFTTTESAQNGWSIAKASLKSLAGKDLRMLSLNFKPQRNINNYNLKLGQLSIKAENYTPQGGVVTNLKSQNELQEAVSDIRLTWDAAKSDDIHHYNVYFERSGETKKLVGQTRNEGFYIDKFARKDESEKEAKVYVRAVTKDMKEVANEATLTLKYPALTAPEVRISASKTLATIGSQIEFTAYANKFPKKYEWVTPKGATLVSTTENKATFKFDQAGLYAITVKVSNGAGTTTKTVEGFVEISDEKTLQNVARGGQIKEVSGYTNEREHPRNLLDGVGRPGDISKKWCAGGSFSHWVVIDLKKAYNLYRFKFFDCRPTEGFENVSNYKIELSNDGVKWEEVLNEQNIPQSANEKEAWIKPTTARYIRFTPYDKEQPITIRIWEFEAYGIETKVSIGKIDVQQVNINEKLSVEVPYSLGGVDKASNFAVSASSDNTLVSVDGTVTADDEKIKLTLLAGAKAGESLVTVKLVNGSTEVSSEFQLNIVDPSRVNILLNKPVTHSIGGDAGATGEIDGLDTSDDPAVLADGKTDVWFLPGLAFSEFTSTLEYDLKGLHSIYAFRMKTMEDASREIGFPRKVEVFASATDKNADSYKKVLTLEPGQMNDLASFAEEDLKAKYIKIVVTIPEMTYVLISELEVVGAPIKTPMHAITSNVAGQGKIEFVGIEDLTKVAEGTEVTVKVTPDDDWKLSSLKANGQDISKTLKFTVNGPVTVDAVFIKKTGLEGIVASGLRLYPNLLNQGEQAMLETDQAGLIRVLSLSGVTLWQGETLGGKVSIPTANLSSGTYIIALTSAEGVQSLRFVVR